MLLGAARVFAPDTPARFAPAMIFFLVAGGFLTSLVRPAEKGSMVNTVVRHKRPVLLAFLPLNEICQRPVGVFRLRCLVKYALLADDTSNAGVTSERL